MIADRWVKLHLRITEWEWYRKPETAHLFMHLILCAAPSDTRVQGAALKRGSLATSVSEISEKTGLSVRKVRTSLSRLAKSGELTIKSTNKMSIITICKYDVYQCRDCSTDKQLDNQPTNSQKERENFPPYPPYKEKEKENKKQELIQRNTNAGAREAEQERVWFDEYFSDCNRFLRESFVMALHRENPGMATDGDYMLAAKSALDGFIRQKSWHRDYTDFAKHLEWVVRKDSRESLSKPKQKDDGKQALRDYIAQQRMERERNDILGQVRS